MAKNSKKSFKIAAAILVLALVVGLSWTTQHYYRKYDKLSGSSPEEFQKEKNKSIIATVAKAYALPKDEDPVVGALNDKDAENIKKQYPVLDSAEKGDYLLVYQKSKKAILYRPSTKQVIKEVPVSLGNNAKLKVYGSETARKDVEKTLSEQKIVYSDGGSSKSALSGVVIVDVSGKNGDAAKALAEKLKGSVGSLPDGEDKPVDTDIAIYVGEVITP